MMISRLHIMLTIPFLAGSITFGLIEMSVLSGPYLLVTQVVLFLSVIFLIWEGSNLLVQSSQEIAKHFNVSTFLIGLTVVAFGTSLPEVITSMVAGFGGKGNIAVSNIVGSNILNVSVILGGLALLTRGGLLTNRQSIWLEVPILILGTVLALLFLGQPPFEPAMFDGFISLGLLNLRLDFIEAVILMSVFILYLYIIISNRGRTVDYSDKPETETENYYKQQTKVKESGAESNKTLLPKIIRTVGGLAIVMIGCHILVGEAQVIEGVTRGYGAVWFASTFGIPDYLVGLSIVALGTSVPEIVVSLSAVKSKSVEIGVGNILGSAIFNLFAALGLTGLFVQSPLADSIVIDIGALRSIIAMGFLFVIVFIFLSTRKCLSRKEGFVLFCTGVIYMIYEMVNSLSRNNI